MLDGLKDFFGINSPSKVMADQVGKNLALGIGEGFEDNIGGVNKMINKSMQFDGAKISGGIAGNLSSNGAGVSITQYITNTAPTSRVALWKTEQNTLNAVKLALSTI